MTIGYTGAWTSKAGLLVKDTGAGKACDAQRQGQANAGIGGKRSQRAQYEVDG